MDIAELVSARLDEDEAALRDDDGDQGENRFADMDERTHRYVWRFADNDRVKREIETDRQLLNLYADQVNWLDNAGPDSEYEPGTISADYHRGATEALLMAVRWRATKWSDHQDYDETWRP